MEPHWASKQVQIPENWYLNLEEVLKENKGLWKCLYVEWIFRSVGNKQLKKLDTISSLGTQKKFSSSLST